MMAGGRAGERREKSEEDDFREKGRKRDCPARVRELERANAAKSCPRYQIKRGYGLRRNPLLYFWAGWCILFKLNQPFLAGTARPTRL